MTLRPHLQIALVAILVAGLAIADWRLDPSRAGFWILAMGAMAAVWAAVALIGRGGPDRGLHRAAFLVRSAAAAGLMIAVSLAMPLIAAMGSGGLDIGKRVAGMVIGLLLLLIGNSVPKQVGSLVAGRCSPARTQGLQRLAGWAFALAGLVSTGIWLAAPVALAENLAIGIVGGAVVLVAAGVGWARYAHPV